MTSQLVPIDVVRALPTAEQPASTAVTFRGGMMHGQARDMPWVADPSDSVPLIFTGYDHGQAVTHRYRCIGWLPDKHAWAYDLEPTTEA